MLLASIIEGFYEGAIMNFICLLKTSELVLPTGKHHCAHCSKDKHLSATRTASIITLTLMARQNPLWGTMKAKHLSRHLLASCQRERRREGRCSRQSWGKANILAQAWEEGAEDGTQHGQTHWDVTTDSRKHSAEEIEASERVCAQAAQIGQQCFP